MWNGTACGWLSGPGLGVGCFRPLLRFWAVGESTGRGGTICWPWRTHVAPMQVPGEVKLRLTGRADTAGSPGPAVPVAGDCRERRPALFGRWRRLAGVAGVLRQRGQTLAVAE